MSDVSRSRQSISELLGIQTSDYWEESNKWQNIQTKEAEDYQRAKKDKEFTEKFSSFIRHYSTIPWSTQFISRPVSDRVLQARRILGYFDSENR